MFCITNTSTAVCSASTASGAMHRFVLWCWAISRTKGSKSAGSIANLSAGFKNCKTVLVRWSVLPSRHMAHHV